MTGSFRSIKRRTNGKWGEKLRNMPFGLTVLVFTSVLVAGGMFLFGPACSMVDGSRTSSAVIPDTSRIDTEPPIYKLLHPDEDQCHQDPYQEVRIKLIDELSRVDASTIDYRITTQGLSKWSQWLPYKDADDGTEAVVILREYFRRGDDNYVQVRSRDLAGNPASISRPFNIKINSCPVIVVDSPIIGGRLIEGTPIVFDAEESYDSEGDQFDISWYRSTPTGIEPMGDSSVITVMLPRGEHTITIVASDDHYNEVRTSFTITVIEEVEIIAPDHDEDRDGIPDVWETRFQTDPKVKDSGLDPDGDGYSNLEEYQYNTNPQNKISRPPTPPDPLENDSLGIFSQVAWPLWAILVVLILFVVLTMLVIKFKKDRQVDRIMTIRRKVRVTPSVSWDQVATTAYISPMTGTMALRVPAENSYRSLTPQPGPDQVILPESEVKKREISPAPSEEAAPEPVQDVHASQAGNIPPPGDLTGIRLLAIELVEGAMSTENRTSGKGKRFKDLCRTVPMPFRFGFHRSFVSHNDHSSLDQFSYSINKPILSGLSSLTTIQDHIFIVQEKTDHDRKRRK